MIVAALLRGSNFEQFQASSGFPWHGYQPVERRDKDDVLDDRILKAMELLERAWMERKCGEPKLKSTTYGAEDILSLSWHYDLFRSDLARRNSNSAEVIAKSCEEMLRNRAEHFARASSSYLAICEAFRDRSTPATSDGRIGDSSYILLRFVRCLKSLAVNGRGSDAQIRSALTRAGKRLQSKLHDHLSLAEITDSRFDPAELAFCLEGLLHVKPEQIDFPLLDRVISVLGKAQEQSAYWRSETPIVIQQRGHVLFPIGVEVARSILNSVALFVASGNAQGRRQEFQSQHLTVLKRYWAWLKSRQTTIRREGRLLYGWHSEHINDPDLVHTWETSQILEFLLGFKAVLAAHTADQLLALSRLDVRYPGKAVNWTEIVEGFEPYYREPHNVYARIGTDFVDSRQPGVAERPKNWSMLLYGPPGTGKSTIAENLGDCLRMPVITVTVSDFLGEGESRMESRVKNIFTVIERQFGSIVLFDEMDQFLLDRNSTFFREQDSVFKFLTPGMLTKFAKLRKLETVIFIIATNYEERIDSAIKRSGRVDQRYLVLPPDNRRRMNILMRDATCVALMEGAVNNNQAYSSEKVQEMALEASCLLAYPDIKRVVAHSPETFEKLIELLEQAPRNIQFSAMTARYLDSPTKGLEAEIEGLICLIDEAQKTRMSQDGRWEGSGDFRKFIAELKAECSPRKLHDQLDREKDERMYHGPSLSSRSRKPKASTEQRT
jgi:hypothetical protein